MSAVNSAGRNGGWKFLLEQRRRAGKTFSVAGAVIQRKNAILDSGKIALLV